MKIILTPEELVAKLEADLKEILRLRDENHFRRGRPDEPNGENEYDSWEDQHYEQWAQWADDSYRNNNRMGEFIVDAQKLVVAIKDYIHVTETARETNQPSIP